MGVTVMKILRGTLTETRYEFPEEGSEEQKEMKVISKKRYEENQVAYMADELGLHRITNEGSDFAVSLHREYSLKKMPLRILLTLGQYTHPQMLLVRDATSSMRRRAEAAMCRDATTSLHTVACLSSSRSVLVTL
jgi:hypothetical protein